VILGPASDQDHADGNGEWRSNHASGDVIGIYSKSAVRLDGRCAPCVAKVVIHSQVASQGTGVVNVHDDALLFSACIPTKMHDLSGIPYSGLWLSAPARNTYLEGTILLVATVVPPSVSQLSLEM
jgi:hypothetical protein